jgi:hypothetical protein
VEKHLFYAVFITQMRSEVHFYRLFMVCNYRNAPPVRIGAVADISVVCHSGTAARRFEQFPMAP